MMEDYAMMDDKGYFNKGPLGTSYDQMVQLMATGKAAMEIMGTGVYRQSMAANPQADMGISLSHMRKKASQCGYPSAIALGLGAAMPKVKNIRMKLSCTSISGLKAGNNAQLLTQAKSFPVFKDVNPDLDTRLKELVPYINVGTYNFLDQNWPAGVQDTNDELRGFRMSWLTVANHSQSTIC